MNLIPRRVVFGAAALWACAAVGVQEAASPPQAPPARATTATELTGTVRQYCAGCHNERAGSEATATGSFSIARMWRAPPRTRRCGRRSSGGCAPAACRLPACRGPTPAAYRSAHRPSRRHARSRGGGAAEPGPPRGAPSEPQRIRQRDPRSAGARRRHRGAAAAGRLGRRLRQQRRPARRLAGAARAIPLGGGPHQRAGGGQPGIVPGSETYRIRGDALADRTERRRCRRARAEGCSPRTRSRSTAST